MNRNCEAAGKDMTAFLAGELSGEERKTLSAHLAECPECAREYKEFAEVWRLAGETLAQTAGGTALPEDALAAVESVRAAGGRGRFDYRKAVRGIAALFVACVVICAVIEYSNRRCEPELQPKTRMDIFLPPEKLKENISFERKRLLKVRVEKNGKRDVPDVKRKREAAAVPAFVRPSAPLPVGKPARSSEVIMDADAAEADRGISAKKAAGRSERSLGKDGKSRSGFAPAAVVFEFAELPGLKQTDAASVQRYLDGMMLNGKKLNVKVLRVERSGKLLRIHASPPDALKLSRFRARRRAEARAGK